MPSGRSRESSAPGQQREASLPLRVGASGPCACTRPQEGMPPSQGQPEPLMPDEPPPSSPGAADLQQPAWSGISGPWSNPKVQPI